MGVNTQAELKTISPVAFIKTDFKEKFGVPRQSFRAPSAMGEIVFIKQFNHQEAIKGIEGFTHLWLIFGFNKVDSGKNSLSVRPPRLGGNKKVGVFASRSPFRHNNLGLSSVKLEKINITKDGISLFVSGVDLVDGTPIYDIKPYLPACDCHTDAKGGFADNFLDYKLKVHFPESLKQNIPVDKLTTLTQCLADDPRPSYQNDDREYGLAFDCFNVKFIVTNDILKVTAVTKK